MKLVSRFNGYLALVLAMLTSLFFVDAQVFDEALTPKWTALSVITFVCFGLGFWSSKQSVPRAVIIVSVLMLLAMIPGMMSAGFNPQSIYFLLKTAVFLAAVWLFSMTDLDAEFVALILSSTLAISALWGMFQWIVALENWTISHEASYEIAARFGHRNQLVEFIACLLPSGLYAMMSKARITRIIGLTGVLLGSLFLTVVLARTGWIAITVSFVLFNIFHRKRLVYFNRWMWIVPLILLAVLLVFVDDWFTIWHHFEMAFDFESGTSRDRLRLLQFSWQLFIQHPFSGIGWGSWPQEVMQFDQFGMLTENATHFYRRPHNDFLLLLSEGGFLPGLVFIVLLIIGFKQSLRFSERSERFWLYTSLTLFSLLLLIGFPLERMELSILFALFLGLTLKASFKVFQFNKIIQSFGLLACGLSAFWFSNRWQSERDLQEMISDFESNDWSEVLEKYEEIDPNYLAFDHMGKPLEWYAGVAKLELGNLNLGCAMIDEAHAKSPYQPHILNSRGICAFRLKNENVAKRYFYRAIRFHPTYNDSWVNLAAIHWTDFDYDRAIELLAYADPETASETYDQLAMHLSIREINGIISQYDHRSLVLTMMAVRNTPHWAVEVFKKSVKNCIPFEEQLLVDSFYYMLANCTGQADCDSTLELKRKLLPDEVIEIDGELYQ